MSSHVIQAERSIVPACDVGFDAFKDIVRKTSGVEGIGGYKVGVSFLDVGLYNVVQVVRCLAEGQPVIYDHQKAGTDIHEKTPGDFMGSMVRAGVDAIILFPQAGPVTQYEWTRAAQEEGLGVIVGGEMTHPRYLETDLSEGGGTNYTDVFADLGIDRQLPGYIRRFAPGDMYELAARMGVTDFVMPGNKPDQIVAYRDLVVTCGIDDPAIYSPGLVAQGGEISEGAEAAGKRFHGIVGRGITQAKDYREAAEELTSQL
jgi:orotidine-5'-phosphate decarboxylase